MKNLTIKTKLFFMVVLPFLPIIILTLTFLYDKSLNLSTIIPIVFFINLFLFLFLFFTAKNIMHKLNKLEEQLIHQSKNATMGEMMRAIIHQWKQPLNAISIANSALSLQMEFDKLTKEFLFEQTGYINEQIVNMNDTMDNFRNFFKPQDKQIYNISDSINQVNKMIERVFIIDNVNINTELEKDLFTKGISNELNQVFINILNNARDIIKETNCEINDVFVKAYKEDNKCVVTITDCAGGVPINIIDKIFDPYVTTKSEDKGTGIGLDMSKTIIKKVGGELSVKNVITVIDNKEYKGACFIIKLDLYEEDNNMV